MTIHIGPDGQKRVEPIRPDRGDAKRLRRLGRKRRDIQLQDHDATIESERQGGDAA